MQRLKKYLMPFLLLIFFIFPSLANAQITPTPALDPGCIKTDFGCVPTDPAKFVKEYYGIGLSFIGGLSLLFIIFGGYLILTSAGNPQQLNNGKSYIGYAIIGVLLAIFGFLFVEVIARDILHIPGFV